MSSFEWLLGQIRPVDAGAKRDGNGLDALIDEVARCIEGLPEVTRESLASILRDHGHWVPVLALCVGLSQEQLKNHLRHRFKTSRWRALAQKNPRELVTFLDEQFGLVQAVGAQRSRMWSFGDVLKERLAWSRRRAIRSAARGRVLEDAVEQVLRRLGLKYVMRTAFEGRGRQMAPCDFAIPEGGPEARIVGAIKGFDSTGSKLTDAVREVEQMAQIRSPLQFVYVVVDGIGWLNRRADLRRLWNLFTARQIDGLYTRSMLGDFEEDVRRAAQRLGMLPMGAGQEDG